MTTLHFERMAFAYPGPRLFGRTARRVFDDFSWASPVGRTVLLGPNGAGKTTLLSLGASLFEPQSGVVRVDELNSSRRRDRRRFRQAVGWMPQQVRPIAGFTAREQVAYAGWLKGMSRAQAWEAAVGALARVALADEADRPTSRLSGGQQRRVGIAQLLVYASDVLLLDEPTAGLDPGQRARFREMLVELADGRTAIVSTHQVDDLTDLFDTVVVLDQGRIQFQGSVSEFMALAPDGVAHPAEAAYASLVTGEL